MAVLESIIAKGYFAYLHGFGAIDAWLNQDNGLQVCHSAKNQFTHILTNADTADLAKLFENLRYPGVDLADAALEENDKTWYFRCVDSISDYKPSFVLLDFYKDCKTNAYIFPHGVHPFLKQVKQKNNNVSVNQKPGENYSPVQLIKDLNNTNCFNPDSDYTQLLMDTVLILAKYFDPNRRFENLRFENRRFEESNEKKYINKIKIQFQNKLEGQSLNQEQQRIFLCELVTSPNPGLGFELLKISGFIGMYWPELENLCHADHSKEHHPEGNAWEHTMETFRHRKLYDLKLSLGLLLHDSGKPIATSTGGNRYDGHAELGEIQARRFLERLGFQSSLIQEVCFLVRHHMLPAALPRLPFFRTEQIMSSPLFPLLMELYRCDESSSFKGLDGYYDSSAVYQQFLRNKKNPYRTADGRKKDLSKL